MLPSSPQNRPPILIDVNTLPALFGQVEIQISYLTEGIKALSNTIDKAEESNNSRWMDYIKAHTEVVSETKDNSKHLSELEVNLNKTAYNLSESIQKTALESARSMQSCMDNANISIKGLSISADEKIASISNKVDSIDKQVASLIFVHKILIGVAVFFSTSVGALIWAIITHQITLARP